MGRLSVAACVVVLLLCTSVAFAQSTISGQVRDTSGAVMAGVAVEAASPALIERARTVTTNGEGRYAIVDVRPGTYTVTFTMSGFSTVKEEVEVPANVTVPVDASMQVGAVGQTVEVQAQIATVDVENVAHPEVLTRDDIDSVPSARNPQSMASYVPGVHINLPDVGGMQQIEQTYVFTHGNPSARDTYLFDGMMINTTQADGQIQIYVDNALIQEVTYQTSNVTAEVTGGGVYTNMIPKDGGNAFHGNLFLGYVPSQFVGSNVDAALIARNVSGQSAVNRLEDFDGALGGPIKRDKLWFLLSARKQLSFVQAVGSTFDNGSPGIERSYIYTGALRLTYQINSKNKFAAMWIRDWKTKENDVVTGAGGLSDVGLEQSSLERTPVMYYILQSRWTSTPTPKLLFQTGFSFTKLDYDILYHKGVLQPPFSPAWFADATQLDLTLLTRRVAGSVNTYAKYERWYWNATGAYITGSHQFKFGVTDSLGPAYVTNIANGDAYYNYTNGVPLNITAFDTPTYQKPRLNADLGLYGMDTWHIKRLAITAGLRWEYLSAQLDPQNAPAGRFVPARNFAKVDCNTIKGLGCFKDWTPRLGIVYDVFGTHKTAFKAGIGKYNSPLVSGFLNNFNPMFLTSESIAWVNRPTTACQLSGCFPAGNTFGDGNLGANPNPHFGKINDIGLDPNYHREYQWQYNIGVQQQVARGVTLNFNWNHTSDYQQALNINYAVPASAWTPFQITNPLDGTPITVFNLAPSYFGLTPALHQTNAPQSLRLSYYTGFETSVSARLPRGAFIFGGWTIEHGVDRGCDLNPNPVGFALNDPNSLRFCDWTGSLYQDLGKVPGIPFRSEFKLQTNVPLKYGIEVNASLYSDPVFSTNYGLNSAFAEPTNVFAGGVNGYKQVNWTISPSATYPKDCSCPNPGALVDPGLAQGNEVIQLIAPGTRFTPRVSQFDLGIRKIFHLREKYSIIGEGQIFNLFNVNTPLTESYTLGTSIKPYVAGGPGGVPSVLENPRMLRLNLQFKF
ncbi:MAG TPA: TonB-dependent receptor [Alphaproteobacteria bacterium]|nr:TonB-dependent receptor [Alphaproteobacteria bacterium]